MLRGTLTAGVLLAAAAAVDAEFILPQITQVPVDRLVANLERLVQEKPGDAQLRVNLARVGNRSPKKPQDT